ncbi:MULTISPECIES: DUF6988 family protein [Pseudomonadaceae]|uniref:DUF6988 family protein n=1 Tax=Pseudomonadaceae TaxID=135621 RepID=UPI00366DC20C
MIFTDDGIPVDLDKILAQSVQFEAHIADFFALPLHTESNRFGVVRTLTSLGFEHSQGLKHLTAARLCTSAAVLLRVQYESFVRALWVMYCATDKEVDLMVAELTHESAKQASKIPMLSQMLVEIEQKAPHAPVSHLNEFKHYSWKPLSSFVHGGLHAVNRHGRGFPLELACMLVRHSNGLLAIAGNLLLIIAGIPANSGLMSQIYKNFEDCLPPRNPPYARTNEPAH